MLCVVSYHVAYVEDLVCVGDNLPTLGPLSYLFTGWLEQDRDQPGGVESA